MSSRDSGWAWIVCAALAIYNLVIAGTFRSLGILHLGLSGLLEDDLATITWMGTTLMLVTSLLAPVAGTIENGFTHRNLRLTIIVGCLTIVFGIALSAWCQNAVQIILTFGLISGLSLAAMGPAVMSFLGIYFEERRELAAGIMYAGGSLGGLTMPSLFTWVASFSGYRGALMVLAGLWLHMLAVAAVCRPLVLKEENAKGDRLQPETVANTRLTNQSVARFGEVSSIHTISKFRATEDVSSYPQVMIQSTATHSIQANGMTSSRFMQGFKDYCKFLFRPQFVVLNIIFIFGGLGSICSYILIPLLLDEFGFEETFASQVIMIASLTELISRPIFAVIGDRLGKKKTYLLLISFLMTAVFGLFVVVTQTTLSILVHAVVLGLFGSVYIPFMIPMLMEISSEGDNSRVAGLIPFLLGSGSTFGQPLLSWTKQVFGTHVIGLIITSTSYFFASFCIVAWAALNHKKKSRKLTYDVSGIMNSAFSTESRHKFHSVARGSHGMATASTQIPCITAD